MQNTIEIFEYENRLHNAKDYLPIICGNTNYKIKFEFSESWQACNKKTAFFVVEGKKIPVEFEGNVCDVPAMPNVSSFLVFLVASSNDKQILSSTPVRIDVEKNPSMDKLKKTEPFKSYYASLLGAINNVETGNIVVGNAKNAQKASYAEKAGLAEAAESSSFAQSCAQAQTAITAETANVAKTAQFAETATKATAAETATRAESCTLAERATTADSAVVSQRSSTQVSLTGDEDISGEKNFVDSVKKQGKPILNSKEVCNPNLLINGDFKINQRGKTTYNTVGQYTVDRWKLVSGTVTVVDGGIRLNGTIEQVFEKEIDVETIGSAGFSGGQVDIGYSKTRFTITAIDIVISWVKLEVGKTPTGFSPKSYTQELSDCYRYYYKNGSSTNKWFLYGSANVNFSTSASCIIVLPVTMRTTPTLSYTGNFRFIASNDKGYSLSKISVGYMGTNTLSLTLVGSGMSGAGFLNGNDSATYLMLDAEIY